MSNYATARMNMVDGQIRPNKVTDAGLLASLGAVPRELFVPKAARAYAYVDEDVAIGNGRYLMEPLVLARLLQEAQISDQDVVLDIGCATGYSTAVISRLANTVVALESDAELVARASELLTELDIENAVAVQTDVTEGYPDQAPYDVIVVNGAVAEAPQRLLDQLGENGRLVAVIARSGHHGTARLFKRMGGHVSSRPLFDAATPVLPGFEPRSTFVF